MKDLGHFLVSTIKSFIRIIGAGAAYVGVSNGGDPTKGVMLLAAAFGLAEVFGIVEELVDKRK